MKCNGWKGQSQLFEHLLLDQTLLLQKNYDYCNKRPYQFSEEKPVNATVVADAAAGLGVCLVEYIEHVVVDNIIEKGCWVSLLVDQRKQVLRKIQFSFSFITLII